MGDDTGAPQLRGSAPTASLDRAVSEREEIMIPHLDATPPPELSKKGSYKVNYVENDIEIDNFYEIKFLSPETNLGSIAGQDETDDKDN